MDTQATYNKEGLSYLCYTKMEDQVIKRQFRMKIAHSKMKFVAIIFLLVALTTGFKIFPKKAQLISLAKNKGGQCGPDETDCGFSGCCPEPNWICCPDPDPTNCAATWEDCPFEAKRIKLVKLAKDNQCGPDDTECPFGCCPNPYTYCCPDMDCATSAEWCPWFWLSCCLLSDAEDAKSNNEFNNFSLVNPINEFVLIAVLIAVLSKNCFLLYTMCEREKTKQDWNKKFVFDGDSCLNFVCASSKTSLIYTRKCHG